MWSLQTKVDMNKYDKAPLYNIMALEEKRLLDRDYYQNSNAILDVVSVESQNSWVYVAGDSTYSNTFYNSARFVDRSEQWINSTRKILVSTNMYLSSL